MVRAGDPNPDAVRVCWSLLVAKRDREAASNDRKGPRNGGRAEVAA